MGQHVPRAERGYNVGHVVRRAGRLQSGSYRHRQHCNVGHRGCHHDGQHSTQTVPTPTVSTINTAHKLFLPPPSVLSTQHTNCSYPHRQYYQHSTQTVPIATVSTINTAHKLFLPPPSVLSTQHTNCSYRHRQHCNVEHRGCHHDCQHSTQTVPTPTVSIVNIVHKLHGHTSYKLGRHRQHCKLGHRGCHHDCQHSIHTLPIPTVSTVNIAYMLFLSPPSALST